MTGKVVFRQHLRWLGRRRRFAAAGMGGRAVEGSGLENRRACKRTVGSNPTPSARAASYLIDLYRIVGLDCNLTPTTTPNGRFAGDACRAPPCASSAAKHLPLCQGFRRRPGVPPARRPARTSGRGSLESERVGPSPHPSHENLRVASLRCARLPSERAARIWRCVPFWRLD
jgi:hypothetical protein